MQGMIWSMPMFLLKHGSFVPPSRTVTMTSTNFVCSAYTYNFSRDVLPRLRARSNTRNVWIPCYTIRNDSMIPRRVCWRCIPRKPHICCTKGTYSRSSSIHHQRSVLLCIPILSLRGLTPKGTIRIYAEIPLPSHAQGVVLTEPCETWAVI